MHEAAMAAVEEKLTSLASWGSSPCIIKETHFKQALAKITPSLSDKVYIYIYGSILSLFYMYILEEIILSYFNSYLTLRPRLETL